jgi:acetylornithine deacetylase/succinyl-diaminopimelate desuccinylase-like protein
MCLRSTSTPVVLRALSTAVLWLGLAGAAAAQSATAAPAVKDGAPAPPDGRTLLADIQVLTAPGMDGRGTGTPGNAKARAWIVERLGAIRPLEAPFTFTSKAGVPMQGVNVVATCGGRRQELPPIVISAHYDHLGIRDGQTYHGADDNASGVAMLLAVAARCQQTPFSHPLVLAFLDAEEQGLQGARAFIAQSLARRPIALNINFDMVSRSAGREIYVAGPGR